MRWAILLFIIVGCNAGGLPGSTPDGTDPRNCSPLVEAVKDEGQVHVDFGTVVTYAHNPPASGPHWPSTHPWGQFGEVVPRMWWVHNLEHGGIVLLYNCPGLSADAGAPDSDAGAPWPCPEITTPLRQLMNEMPLDKWNEVRMIVTGDPVLNHTVAAVAWGWSYQADKIDLKALRCFRDTRYGRGPEDAP